MTEGDHKEKCNDNAVESDLMKGVIQNLRSPSRRQYLVISWKISNIKMLRISRTQTRCREKNKISWSDLLEWVPPENSSNAQKCLRTTISDKILTIAYWTILILLPEQIGRNWTPPDKGSTDAQTLSMILILISLHANFNFLFIYSFCKGPKMPCMSCWF